MSKETIYIMPAEIFSYGYDPKQLSVLLHFEGYRAEQDGSEEFMIDIPMHEDYYDAMKFYCSQYEKYMLDKFAEK
jgi:hypothetical protein